MLWVSETGYDTVAGWDMAIQPCTGPRANAPGTLYAHAHGCRSYEHARADGRKVDVVGKQNDVNSAGYVCIGR